MNITEQQELDYMNAAQIRVAADTGLLEKRATITVPAHSASVELPDELISIEGVFNGTNAYSLIQTVEYMRVATGSPITISDTPLNGFFVVIARTLYIWPTATTDLALTVYYTYRPAVIDTESSFELIGSAKRLIERLTSAYVLFDDGQPELGQGELASYQKDAQRLKHRNDAAWGGGGQLHLAGRRRAGG